jgi:hypothetical protein
VENDDDERDADTYASYIEWTAPKAGTYYIMVEVQPSLAPIRSHSINSTEPRRMLVSRLSTRDLEPSKSASPRRAPAAPRTPVTPVPAALPFEERRVPPKSRSASNRTGAPRTRPSASRDC